MARNRSEIAAGLGRERAAALTCDGRVPLWRVTPNQRLIADGIKAQQKVALFLGKSGKLCYTINHSPGRTRVLAAPNEEKTNVAEMEFRQLAHNLRWRPEFFLFESVVTL